MHGGEGLQGDQRRRRILLRASASQLESWVPPENQKRTAHSASLSQAQRNRPGKEHFLAGYLSNGIFPIRRQSPAFSPLPSFDDMAIGIIPACGICSSGRCSNNAGEPNSEAIDCYIL